jgi:ribosomal-protein-alanine N-acetyltransferase
LNSRLGPRSVAIEAGDIQLLPVTPSDIAGFLELLEDEDVSSFTPLRRGGGLPYVEELVDRYANGWINETSADFAILSAKDGFFLGYAGLVRLELDARQAQLGYMVSPHARNRGVATRAVNALTDWAFSQLGLIRVELRISDDNIASLIVAERCGYTREGVLRSAHTKDGRRTDLSIWSRLLSDCTRRLYVRS